MRELQHLLIAWELLGERRRDAFARAAEEYVRFYLDHMRVEETQLLVRMGYADFDDFWAPIAGGEGPLGKFVGTLGAEELSRATDAVRDAYCSGRPDGPRSFANIAWACRGIVP